MLRAIAVTFLVLWHANAFPNEMLAGKYSSVSEADCDTILVLRSNGTGSLIEECRAEEPGDVDETYKQSIRWHAEGTKITIIKGSVTKLFEYHRFLSCEDFGEKGSQAGLVSDKEKFWKTPIKCR